MNDGVKTGELVIPSNVAKIERFAFSNCAMLEQVAIKDGNSAISLERGVFWK